MYHTAGKTNAIQRMGKLINIVLVGGIIGYVLYQEVLRAIKNFQFKIIGYGLPKRSGWLVIMPIQFEFVNPTKLDIVIDNLMVDIFIYKSGAWVQVAKVNQPITIGAGTSRQIISASLDFSNIFSGNLLDTVASVFRSSKIDVYSEVTARFKGITLPKQKFQQAVSII